MLEFYYHASLDSDESPVARERTMVVHVNQHIYQDEMALGGRPLNTKDSGCQTDDVLIAAPSRRRIRAQRNQGIPASLSHSTGNISSLPDHCDATYTTAASTRLRSRSLPRDGSRLRDNDEDDSDDDEDEDEDDDVLSPYEPEHFLSGSGTRILKDEEESTDDQAMPELQIESIKHICSPESPWIERGRSRFPRKSDLGSCEISSSSDTFSSPIHSVSTAGVLGNQIDQKEDHQSSSGNWSGSSSTCPSQTSETLPPAASPPLTGFSHCDSELSLNAGCHIIDDTTGFIIDPCHIDKTQSDQMDDAGVSTASDGEWNCNQDQQDQPCLRNYSPKHLKEDESGVSCPSYSSGETYESFSGQSHAEKSESGSLYRVEHENFHTSMHFYCELKEPTNYYDYAAIEPICGPNANMVSGMGEYTQPDYKGLHMLGRTCLSLRKPKVKPPPPKRSSSLKETGSTMVIPEKNQPKMNSELPLPLSSRDMRLQLELAGSVGHRDSTDLCDKHLVTWGIENIRELLDCSSPFSSSDTHSFKDEGAVQSDYADLWLLNDLKSSDPYQPLSNSSTAAGSTIIQCVKAPEIVETQAVESCSRPASPPLLPPEGDLKLGSPEKPVGLASPSSGYSSQSETPTSSFSSAFFPGPLSPNSGKRKPKVPERKSSLSSQQLSLRDPGSSHRRDSHVKPPSHLDLSALYSKTFAHRNQLHILHQNKQKAAVAAAAIAEARAAAAAAANLSNSSSTSNVLRSVQAQSTDKVTKGNHEQAKSHQSAGQKYPTVTTDSGSTDNRNNRKPPAYKPPSAQTCESQFSPPDTIVTPHERIRIRQQRYGPGTFWAMTAFRTSMEAIGAEDDPVRDPDTHGPQQGCSSFPAAELKLKDEHSQVSRLHTEPSLVSTLSPPAYSEIHRSDVVSEKVPARCLEAPLHTCNIITIRSKEDDDTSSTKSASHHGHGDEPTPDSEDYFSKGNKHLNMKRFGC